MNILILGLNYAPEPVGIGPYTAGMAVSVAAAGSEVTVVTAKPYYPAWRVDPNYAGSRVMRVIEDGVRVVRIPIYVPRVPNGIRRLLHHASFALRAQFSMLLEARRARPDVVVAIAPSLLSVIVARFIAKAFSAKLWLHIQDFEVEAAFATGLLNEKSCLGRLAKTFERWAFAADRVSTISPQMCKKLKSYGIPDEKICEFRNWSDVNAVKPLDRESEYRVIWRIDRPYVALYSGNVSNKQGIDIIVEAARLLVDRKDLMFVICGEGPNRANLEASMGNLDNIRFFDLQPIERLSELLGLASVHLLPQIADAADLVLPSKLTNMLASGRPIVATAMPGTGLADEVDGAGLTTSPGSAAEFASAIIKLVDDAPLNRAFGITARARAEERWSKSAILSLFELNLQKLAATRNLDF